MTEFYESMEKKELYERWIYFETENKKSSIEANYYRKQLAKAHEILGRVVHQASERWDMLNLTEYYPTDNLWRRRTITNPSGKTDKK